MKNFKRYLPYIAAVIVTIVLIIANRYIKRSHPMDSNFSEQFYSLVDHSDQKKLDLSTFTPFQWDELTLWTPYGDICDLGINDFEKDGPNCETSNDDAEAYLMFLSQNNLVQKIKLDRKRLDLVGSSIQWRVKKEAAKFEYVTQGDWPKLQLEGQGPIAKPDLSQEPVDVEE
jgi:hypothetical protein